MAFVGEPVCENCGYGLRGIGEDGRLTPCPECAAWFTAQQPYVLRPWMPVIFWAAGAAIAPTAALCAAASALGRRGDHDWRVETLCVLLLATWPVVGVGVPSLVAGRLVRSRVLRPRRTRAGVALALVGVLVNIAVTIALLAR